MDVFTEKTNSFTKTISLKDILGKRVFTKTGVILGQVKEVQFDEKNHHMQGIIVKRMFHKDKYIGMSYISKITPKAIMLSIEPLTFFIGRNVITKDGKKIGVVNKIHRINDTNRIESITIYRGWFRKMNIPAQDVQILGTAIILSKKHSELENGKSTR